MLSDEDESIAMDDWISSNYFTPNVFDQLEKILSLTFRLRGGVDCDGLLLNSTTAQ